LLNVIQTILAYFSLKFFYLIIDNVRYLGILKLTAAHMFIFCLFVMFIIEFRDSNGIQITEFLKLISVIMKIKKKIINCKFR